jgi:hypothetical protein
MKQLDSWTRDLHLYLGLFSCPFILVFAISTVLLNHPRQPAADPAFGNTLLTNIPIAIPEGAGTIEQARKILRQLNVTGEIDYVSYRVKEQRLLIPVSKPGENTRVEVDLRGQTATVERQEQGLSAALIYLHKMPGPHNAKIRGNWIYIAWWRVLADATVYALLFLTASGLYLWWILKGERKFGWALLGAGILSATLLVAAICTA